VDKPTGAVLSLPSGFHIDTFVGGFSAPRKMLLAANGDILLTETAGGKVSVLHRHRTARAAAEVVIATLPSGGGHYTRDIAFSPDGRHLWVSVGSAFTRPVFATASA
jgi:glucose/arabinose dehydrogenase